MCSAQKNKIYKVNKLVIPLVGVTFLLLSTKSVNATTVQVCNTASSCTIGEYLYDDSYLPDTGATCVLNTKNPDGTNSITSQSLTATADGWYGHTFTTSSTEGYYRGEICCDTSGDHMCIDKSFEVKEEVTSGGSSLNTSDIAAAVWGYSGRTLTGFNNIVSDVWGYATRTLTSGANITTTVSNSDLTEIKETSNETRLLLEQLVNKPIIENSLEEVSDLDLGERINESKTMANELYINLLFVGTTVSKTNRDWNKLSDREILDNLNDARNIIGDESDSSSMDSLFGRINGIRDIWGTKEADDLHEEIKAVDDALSFVTTGISSYGKSKALQKELSGASSYISTSEKVLTQINKKITETESLSKLIDNNLAEVNSVLGAWTADSYLSVKDKVDGLVKNVLSINRLPKGNLAIDSVYSDITGEKKLKNKVLGVRALLFANKKLLISSKKTAMVTNWLEEGSIVIKTLITNPSTLISQEVPLKYYLPKEVKQEDIIDSDSGTEVKYDTEKDQLFVEGLFTLKPGETRTIKVRVDDVWNINTSEIDSLLTQAEELSKPLEKSAYFAQGVTLKSDIVVSLNKAKELLKDGVTPEAKIKSYREAEIEVAASKEKIEKLKDLVSLASSSGSILGFVGGSQAIGVWGVVIAIATGFVFMTIYMKKLMKPNEAVATNSSKTGSISNLNKHQAKSNNYVDKIAIFLVLATISALGSSIAVKKIVLPMQVSAKQTVSILGANTIDFKQLKAVELVSIDGVVKVFQNEGTDTVLELIDSGKVAVEAGRGEKRSRVIYEGKEVWVSLENVMSK